MSQWFQDTKCHQRKCRLGQKSLLHRFHLKLDFSSVSSQLLKERENVYSQKQQRGVRFKKTSYDDLKIIFKVGCL